MGSLPPVHPGAILAKEFMEPLGLEAMQLAKGLSIRLRDLRPVLMQEGPITASLALRLARFFGTTPEFWLNLQVAFDLESAQDQLGERIQSEVAPYSAQP